MTNPFSDEESQEQQQQQQQQQQVPADASRITPMNLPRQSPQQPSLPASDYDYHRMLGSAIRPSLTPDQQQEQERLHQQRRYEAQLQSQLYLQQLAQQALLSQQPQQQHKRSLSTASSSNHHQQQQYNQTQSQQSPSFPSSARSLPDAKSTNTNNATLNNTNQSYSVFDSPDQQNNGTIIVGNSNNSSRTSPTSRNDEEIELRYAPMADRDNRKKEPQQQLPQIREQSQTSTRTSDSSKNSIAQNWFALQTSEDRTFWHILKVEAKEVIWELYYFIKDRDWKKKVLTVLVCLASAWVFIDLFFLHHIQGWLQKFMIWMSSHPTLAEFAFIGVYVLATLLFVPPTLLMIGAGCAFSQTCGFWVGIVSGTLSCSLGSIIGSMLSFFRARYMMRDVVYLFRARYPIVRAADQALKQNGFRIMLLLRLCPLVPYHGLNYLGGITGVDWETFVFSLVGLLPYTILVVAMGASAETISQYKTASGGGDDDIPGDDSLEEYKQKIQQEVGTVILTAVGVATFFIAMILTFRFTGKELQKVRVVPSFVY